MYDTSDIEDIAHAYATLDLYRANEQALRECRTRRRIYAQEFCRSVRSLPVPDELTYLVLDAAAESDSTEFCREQRRRITDYVFGNELAASLRPEFVRVICYNAYIREAATALICEWRVMGETIRLQCPLWKNAKPLDDWTVSEFDLQFLASREAAPGSWVHLGPDSASFDPDKPCAAIRAYLTARKNGGD